MPKDQMKKIIKKRLLLFGLYSTIIFLLLGLRLYFIQIYKNQTYSEQALKQRGREISLSPKRGIIYDRNLLPLTNTESTKSIVLTNDILKYNEHMLNIVLEYSSLRKYEIFDMINSDEEILQIPLKTNIQIDNKPLNVFLVDVVDRYSDNSLLSHVIGYVNKKDNYGESGIEKVYDEFLQSKDKKSLFIEYDKSHSMILGGAEFVNEIADPSNPAGVKLTIDYDIQKNVEHILDENNINGAAIVTEVDTGKILAIASRPNYNQEKIEDYLDSTDMALYNKAIQVGYPPGSIFKTVVLLTAFEDDTDLLDMEYYCKGYEDIRNVRIKCTSEHGHLNLLEGFEKSCNSVFIQLGKQLGGKKIIEMAEKLNFGSRINIGLLEEISGKLPQGDDLLGPAIGNISIGQGKIEVTPLQIANLMTIIANKGIQKHLTLVEGITNKDGKVIKEYKREEDKKVLSNISSELAMEYLNSVVEVGTGKEMDLLEVGGGGGKTGSAEAILNKTQTIHGWFAGYFPKYNPKYVITVLVEEGHSGSKSAAPIFEKIAKEINKIYPLY